MIYNMKLKGTATLVITMFYMKDLNKPSTEFRAI